METRNMAKGLHQVFVSKLMELIGTILVTIGGILAATASIVALGAAFSDAELGTSSAGALLGGAAVGSVLVIVGVVLLILCLIFRLVGLGNASKDDPRFKTVLLFALISLACSIISSFVGSIPVLASILKIASTALDLVVVILMLSYTSEALAAKGRNDLAEKGLNVQKLLLVIIILTLIVQIVSIFVALAGVLAIITLVLQIVYWFSFMIFLSKASKALA